MKRFLLWGAQFLITLFSLRCHEWAQTRLARRRGDIGAAPRNWFSLRKPIEIDWIGSVLLPLFLIWRGQPVLGWIKPVAVNLDRLRRPRADAILIALSGSLTQLLLGLAGVAVFWALNTFGVPLSGLPGMVLFDFALINFSLALFNLLPIPPLAGGDILELFLGGDALTAWEEIKPYGFILLAVAVYFNMFSFITMPVTSLVISIFNM